MYRKIITSPFWITLIVGSVWVPQIIDNVRKNNKGIPTLQYFALQTINMIIFPIYICAVDGNILFLRPKQGFAIFLTGWILFQLAVLAL